MYINPHNFEYVVFAVPHNFDYVAGKFFLLPFVTVVTSDERYKQI